MEPVGLEDALRQWAADAPDRVAVAGPAGSVTYGELDDAADRAAGWLARRGIGPGDRIAWLGRNDTGYAVLLVASRRRGACLAGLNWRAPVPELARAYRLVEPSLLVAGTEHAGTAAALEADAGRRFVLPTGGLAWAGEPAEPGATARADPGGLCLLYFTSGSTGRPKAVGLSYGAVSRAIALTAPAGFGPGAVGLIIPPVFHVAGATWVQHLLRLGGTAVFERDGTTLAGAIRGHGVTHALMVPALLDMLLEQRAAAGVSLPSLRYVCYGTAPISTALLRRAMADLGCGFQQMYGTTEAGGVISCLRNEDHQLAGPSAGRLRSAGRPGAGVEVAAFDPATAQRRPAGQEGELWVRTPYVMAGYWRDPAATAAAVTPDGWLRTRDYGRVDADGYVYIAGRLDDAIITGGENVHPAEVEDVLGSMPGLAAAAVVGLDDERWGSRVVAAVVRGDPGVTAGDVIGFCRERLAGYKCPREVAFVAELPRNATGKVVRGQVRELVTELLG